MNINVDQLISDKEKERLEWYSILEVKADGETIIGKYHGKLKAHQVEAVIPYGSTDGFLTINTDFDYEGETVSVRGSKITKFKISYHSKAEVLNHLGD